MQKARTILVSLIFSLLVCPNARLVAIEPIPQQTGQSVSRLLYREMRSNIAFALGIAFVVTEFTAGTACRACEFLERLCARYVFGSSSYTPATSKLREAVTPLGTWFIEDVVTPRILGDD